MPPTRAIGLFARTVYRQLKQAGYRPAELIAFVNEFLEQVKTGRELTPITAIADSETALPNADVLLEALEFELKRARDRREPVTLMCIAVELPDWCADDAASAVHERVARQLRRGVRPSDTVARLRPQCYAVILPGAGRETVDSLAARLLRPVLHPRRKDEAPPAGTRVEARVFCADAEADTAEEMLARCLSQPALELRSPAAHSVPPAPRASSRPSSPSAGDRLVLALGGGAARAAAHIGVLRALKGASVRISGVAATSAGALVGAMALLGMDETAMLNRFQEFTSSPTYREMRRRYATYRRAAKVPRSTVAYFREGGLAVLSDEKLAAFDDDVFEAFVEFFVGPDRDLSTLEGPLVVAATDLVSGRSIHIAHGSLHHALRASCALPGLFLPQADGPRVLVDGSTIAEVPVRAAVGLGVPAPVLAVYLARPERKVTAFATSSEVVLRSGTIVHKELVREQLRHAQHLITAQVQEIGWLDFRRAVDTAEIGYIAATLYLEARATQVDRADPVD